MSGGSIYLLVDDAAEGAAVAVATTLPPSTNKTYKTSTWQFLRLVAACGGPPKTDAGPGTMDRLDCLGTTMEKLHASAAPALASTQLYGGGGVGLLSLLAGFAPHPHLYVFNFAVDPERQRKGYGSVLLDYLGSVADGDGVDIYLETDGERNIAFYTKKGGFEVKHSRVLTCNGSTYDHADGIVVVIRPPTTPSNVVARTL
mmetsp:Transcript_3611/g.14078  ORF Transcript_3611/g.14078 Transcript_3611/m.14078 type:complete len:201 (-) Transcript_3611:431-1033(-)